MPQEVFRKVCPLLIKLQAFSPATLLKRLQHKCFPVKFLRTPILKNICERLLLIVILNVSYFREFVFNYIPYPTKLCQRKVTRRSGENFTRFCFCVTLELSFYVQR